MTTARYSLAGWFAAWFMLGATTLMAQPYPYIPWMPPQHCGQGITWTTVTPQFQPNQLTPVGEQELKKTVDPFATVDKLAEEQKAPEVMKTAANGLTDSPWLTDEELCRQQVAPKIGSYSIGSDCQCADPDFCPPKTNWRFGFEADVLFLRRTQPNLSAVNAAAGTTLFPDNAVDVGYGTRVRMSLEEVDCHNWEVIYFGTDSWNALRNPAATAGAHLPDEFTSQLVSWEFNWDKPHPCREWWTWIAGFRYMQFSERVHWNQTLNNVPVYREIRADNYLWGLQAGFNWLLWKPNEKFYIDSYFKVAGFTNNADNEQYIFGTAPSALLVENHNQFDPFAVLGDMGITSKWRWNNHFSITGGFQYMILDGVALIPDILGPVSDTHTVSFYGGYVGCEVNW